MDIIPANNEEKVLGNTINLVKRVTKSPIIVVDDGSHDKTTEVAKSHGCEVIRFNRNYGKTNAVYAGIKRAIQKDPKGIILIDADITRISKPAMDAMKIMAAEATRQRKIRVGVAQYAEGNHKNGTYEFSGIRTLSMPAAHKLLQTKHKSLAKGYGLEVFMNEFFKNQTKRLRFKVHGRSAFKSIEQHRIQIDNITQTRKKMRKKRLLR
jgi:hypothetical protein